ncbi:methyltransferase domain-containing protein [Candidatus Contubernalis alkalaceticus]|nr:DNA methyltransferase [Candidatus Contubernalis alkalaceticus]UNC92443.1 methyltransferase domain-containing protein [Candidatus Contubernalis alkalaceticus]
MGKDKIKLTKNRCNELDGKTWIRNSISVWDDISKTSEESKLKHPAMFPVSLVEKLLKTFSRRGNTVIDPFMGSGSTLVASAENNRKSVGFDISKEFIQIAEKRLKSFDSDHYRIIQEDARNLLTHLALNSVDLCVTSPPYWNVLREKRSADKKNIRNYGELGEDLGNIENYQQYLNNLTDIFCGVKEVLKPAAYCIVVVMDIRKRSVFFPLHMDLTHKLTELGFLLDDIIIWDRKKEYNNLKPLGFPYVFRVNKVHEYIMIFKKPDS